MNRFFRRELVLLLCVLSLTLHFSAESVGVMDSVRSLGWQVHGSHTHGEEDQFVPTLAQEEIRLKLEESTVPAAFTTGISHSIVPQLPPPKSS